MQLPRKFYHPLRHRRWLLLLSLFFSSRITAQVVSLQVKDAPLANVFLLIEKQIPYSFIYSTEAISKAKAVTLTVDKQPLTKVLDLCFANQPLRYSLSASHIIVQVKESAPVAYVLTGRVVNEAGDPVAGATVAVKGTSLVTITDGQGGFQFSHVNETLTLIVSGAEIEPIELYVTGPQVKVVVQSRVNVLNETIVKGYYTTSRQLNTGTVSKVTAAAISTQPVSNPLAALQGRATGLLITQNSGLPGSGFTVQIRGRNSIQSGNEPLYVLDGVIFASENLSQRATVNVNSPFNNLVPDDIESIEILKDADATAIYGSRGANGVILITTKKGKQGQSKLDVNFYTGWGRATRQLAFMNTSQYVSMRKEAFANDGVAMTNANASDLLLWDTTRYTNWQRLLTGGTAHSTNFNARYSGGSDLTTYAVSANFYRESAVFPGDFADKRFSVYSTLATKTKDKRLDFSITTNYSQEENQIIAQDLSSLINQLPNAPLPYSATGALNWQENGKNFTNPMAFLLRTYDSRINRFTGNISSSYRILPSLILRVNGGINRAQIYECSLLPISSQNPATNPRGTANFARAEVLSWISEGQLSFSKEVFPKLHFSSFVNTTFQHSRNESAAQTGSGYVNDLLIRTINGAANVTVSDNFSLYRYQAISARAEFNYDNSIVLNLTGRRDGSSRFGPGKQFANFGAIGGAWIFSKEDWFPSGSILSFGKLRGSYGITGNDQIGNYQFYDTYVATSYSFLNAPALRPTRLFNPDFGWEQKRSFDLGIETNWWNNKVRFHVTYFNSESGNQLIQYTLPSQTGFTAITRNFPGLVENKGWEFEVGAAIIRHTRFSWTTDFNVTIARNKLLSFPGLESSSYASTYAIGEPLNIRYLYSYKGVDPQTGLYSFVDFNQDGLLNSSDRRIIRSTNPKFYGGWNHVIRFRQWELNLLFQFVRQEGRHPVFGSVNVPGREVNESSLLLEERWRKPGDQAKYQRYSAVNTAAATSSSQMSNSDASITDASYIRVKNAALNYQLPQRILKRIKLSAGSIYVQAQNLFTITNYAGADPENQSVNVLSPLRVIATGIRFTL